MLLECPHTDSHLPAYQVEQYGRPPIKFPVFLGGDNHSSRFGQDVLEALSDAPRYGIRGWLETSNASQIFQWLDVINSAFHNSYTKANKSYKDAWESTFEGGKPEIGVNEFLEIFGGCKALNKENRTI